MSEINTKIAQRKAAPPQTDFSAERARLIEEENQRREAVKLGIQDLNGIVGGAQSRSETLLKAAKSMISSREFADRDNVLHLIEMIADEISGCAMDVDGVAKRLLPVC